MKTTLETQIKKGESAQLEFKHSLSDYTAIIETISAFSNTDGGTILIGVEDNCYVTGVVLKKNMLEDLANKIKLNTDPKILPHITVEDVKGKSVVMIVVEESPSKPVFAFDHAFIL